MKKYLTLFVALLAVLTFATSCKESKTETTLPTSEIGVIDKAAVMKMGIFQKANQKTMAAINALETSYAAKLKGLGEKEQRELYNQFQIEASIIRNKELKQPMDTTQAAIAQIAKEKGLTVILDKSIVISGCTDITEDVKDRIRGEKVLTPPTEEFGSNSKIGYFDQYVVKNLKLFRNVEKEMAVEYKKATEERDKIAAMNLPNEKKSEMIRNLEAQLTAKKEALTTPRVSRVNNVTAEIAKKEHLQLIVDKEFVMYGGKNITTQVVDTLNKN